MNHLCVALTLSFLACSLPASEQAALPASDQRAKEVRTLNTLRRFPEITSKAAWEKPAKEIREHALVCTGLWPMPERTPLNANISGRVERDGYSVEKVYMQTLPGFYFAGNLYRPLGKGKGPFPGRVEPARPLEGRPHGQRRIGQYCRTLHQFCATGNGRVLDDMVGYNDTAQVNHKFASDPTNQLWNISLMGLQTWNSIRALDFLESLPEVDRNGWRAPGVRRRHTDVHARGNRRSI